MAQTLIGIGRLLIKSASHPCRYHIDVDHRRGAPRGAGFLIGSTDVLGAAKTAEQCILRLEDGRSCPVVVTSYHDGNLDAAIVLSGQLTSGASVA